MHVLIRPAIRSDLVHLEPSFGRGWPGLHEFRLEDQESGASLYLLALVDDIPVGHLVIAWDGISSPPLPKPLDCCPDISDVWVVPTMRRQGIAQKLLGEAHHICLARGYTQVGLAVGLDNPGARVLYEALGYVRLPLPPFYEQGRWTDRDGTPRSWREEVDYWTRKLG